MIVLKITSSLLEASTDIKRITPKLQAKLHVDHTTPVSPKCDKIVIEIIQNHGFAGRSGRLITLLFYKEKGKPAQSHVVTRTGLIKLKILVSRFDSAPDALKIKGLR